MEVHIVEWIFSWHQLLIQSKVIDQVEHWILELWNTHTYANRISSMWSCPEIDTYAIAYVIINTYVIVNAYVIVIY